MVGMETRLYPAPPILKVSRPRRFKARAYLRGMASDSSPDIRARFHSFADTFLQGTTEFTGSVSKFFNTKSAKISNEADKLLANWSKVFVGKREEEEANVKTTNT